MPNFLGIDPGVGGAYAVVNEKFQLVHVQNFESFSDLFEAIKEFEISAAVMELVRIQGIGASSQSSTTFMKNAGGLEAILEVLHIRRELVDAQRWQKRFGVSISKTSTAHLTEELKKLRTISTPESIIKEKELKKEKKRISAQDKKRLKLKSVEVAEKFFAHQPKDHNQADAMHLARFAVENFYR